MRSLVIIEVTHGGDTDDLSAFVQNLNEDNKYAYPSLDFTNYSVRVDLPSCFVLD